MNEAALLLAARQFGILHADDLRKCGLSDHAIWRAARSGLLVRMHANVYRVAAVAPGFETRSVAAVTAARGVVGVASRSAARLMGVRGARNYRRIEITVPHARRPRLEGVTVHRSLILDPVDIRVGRDGIPFTRPERTLIDALAGASPLLARRLLDCMLLEGYTTLEQLWLYLTRYSGPGIGGSRVLKELLMARDPRSRPAESTLEDEWLEALARHGVTGLVTQVEVQTSDGKKRVDVGDPDLAVGIEFDSAVWHLTEEDYKRNSRKRYFLILAGWHILPVTEFDLHERVPDVAADFQRLCREVLGRKLAAGARK